MRQIAQRFFFLDGGEDFAHAEGLGHVHDGQGLSERRLAVAFDDQGLDGLLVVERFESGPELVVGHVGLVHGVLPGAGNPDHDHVLEFAELAVLGLLELDLEEVRLLDEHSGDDEEQTGAERRSQ